MTALKSFRYAVISADGELTHHDGELDWDTVIGPEGKVRVCLHPGLAVAGWVNDCGLMYPETYPRNIVSSCLLAALGAVEQPYAGPVVFTGWNPDNTARGLLETESLPDADFLTTVHGDVLKALAGQTPRELSPSWAEQIREVAEHVRTAPTPTITFGAVRPT